MAGVSVKMGVTGVAEFKRSMNESKESVKTFTAALNMNKAALKADGDEERYMTSQASLLKAQLEAQKSVVDNATKALEAMRNNGVDPNSKAFQTMQREVYTATEKMLGIQTELDNVQQGSKDAGEGVDGMNEKLKGIGKGVSWGNVTDGLDKIIHKLERGARAAVSLGKKIYSSAKGSTSWADNLITLSQQTGIDTTTLQQMERIAEIVDTDVDAIINAKRRMVKAATSDSGKKEISEILGIDLTGQNADDLFWEIGDALVNMGESFDKEAAAQKVFGRSWTELLPLFQTGREEYEKMLSEQTTLTEEQVQSLGKADDTIKQLEQEITQLKNAFWAENADKITSLFQWLLDNKDAVVTALTAIAGGFGLLKLGSFALNLTKTINGFKELGLLGGGAKVATSAGADVATGATATGAGWAGGLLNKLTLFAAAGSMYNATEGKINEKWKEFEDATAGMSDEAKQKIALMQTLGMTDDQQYEDFMQLQRAGGSYGGKSFGEEEIPAREVTVVSDEVIHKDRRAGGSGNALEDAKAAESIDRMSAVAGDLNGQLSGMQQADAAMTSAAQNMMNLPMLVANAVAQAVSTGMGNIQIQITRSAVDTINKHGQQEMFDQVVSDIK